MGEDIHQARNATRGPPEYFQRAGGEQVCSVMAGLGQAVAQVLANGVTAQGLQAGLEGDSLAQLAQAVFGQHGVQFRLTEQYHLQQPGTFGFQVSQQAQGFNGGLRHGLGFINHQYRRPLFHRQFNQALVPGFQHLVHIGAPADIHTQLFRHRFVQNFRVQARVGHVGGAGVFVQFVQQQAAQQGLAGAHFAGYLDKALTLAQGHQQQLQSFGMAGRPQEIAGVGRQCKRCFLQSEMALVHQRGAPSGCGFTDSDDSSNSRSTFMRSRLALTSACIWLALATTGRSRITSSLLRDSNRRCLNSSPSSGISLKKGTAALSSSLELWIRPPITTIWPLSARMTLSVSRTVLRASGRVTSRSPMVMIFSWSATSLTDGCTCRVMAPSSEICGVTSREIPEKNGVSSTEVEVLSVAVKAELLSSKSMSVTKNSSVPTLITAFWLLMVEMRGLDRICTLPCSPSNWIRPVKSPALTVAENRPPISGERSAWPPSDWDVK